MLPVQFTTPFIQAMQLREAVNYLLNQSGSGVSVQQLTKSERQALSPTENTNIIQTDCVKGLWSYINGAWERSVGWGGKGYLNISARSFTNNITPSNIYPVSPIGSTTFTVLQASNGQVCNIYGCDDEQGTNPSLVATITSLNANDESVFVANIGQPFFAITANTSGLIEIKYRGN